MTRMSDRELKDRLRAMGRGEPPADLLARLKAEIPEDLAVGGAGLRLAERSERPRVVGIRQITLLAASLLVVIGTGFLAFTVLVPQRSYLDRTAYDQVPEAYVVTVPPKIFAQAAPQPPSMALQDVPARPRASALVAGRLQAAPGSGNRAEAAAKGRVDESRERDAAGAGARLEADTILHRASSQTGETRTDSVALAEVANADQGRQDITRDEKLDTAAVSPALPAPTSERRLETRAPGSRVAENATSHAGAGSGTAVSAGAAGANERILLTVIPVAEGGTPGMILRDGQGHPVAAALVTLTALADGRTVKVRSGPDGVVRASLSSGEYRVEIRTAAGSEPQLATLHVSPDGWRLAPAVSDRR